MSRRKRAVARTRLRGDVGPPLPLVGGAVLEQRPALKVVAPKHGWDQPWHGAFLRAYQRTGMVSKAANEVGLARQTVYEAFERYPRFAAAREALDENLLDVAEACYKHLAIHGWLEPVYHQGDLCGYRRRFEPRMLERLLEEGGRFQRRGGAEAAADEAADAARTARRVAEALEAMQSSVPMQGPSDAGEVVDAEYRVLEESGGSAADDGATG